MIPLLLVAQLSIVSTAPPLRPEQAVAVLRASRSITDRTDVRLVEIPDLPPAPTVITQKAEAPKPPAWAPLNCCSKYEIPLPYPTVRVIIDDAHKR